MSEENTQTENQVETLEAAPVETVAETVVTVVKRQRGRPKGSKNKPKDASAPAKEKKTVKAKVEAAPAPVIVAAKVVAFVPDDSEEVVEAPVEASSDE